MACIIKKKNPNDVKYQEFEDKLILKLTEIDLGNDTYNINSKKSFSELDIDYYNGLFDKFKKYIDKLNEEFLKEVIELYKDKKYSKTRSYFQSLSSLIEKFDINSPQRYIVMNKIVQEFKKIGKGKFLTINESSLENQNIKNYFIKQSENVNKFIKSLISVEHLYGLELFNEYYSNKSKIKDFKEYNYNMVKSNGKIQTVFPFKNEKTVKKCLKELLSVSKKSLSTTDSYKKSSKNLKEELKGSKK